MYPEYSQNVMETLSNTKIQSNNGNWQQNEHNLFLQGLEKYGQNWERISAFVGTRTITQVRSHFQKYNEKLKKDIEKKRDLSIKVRGTDERAVTRFGQKTTEQKGNEPKEQKTKSIFKRDRSSSRHSIREHPKIRYVLGDQQTFLPEYFIVPEAKPNLRLINARLYAQRKRSCSFARIGDSLKITPLCSFGPYVPTVPTQDRLPHQIKREVETDSQFHQA